MNRRLIATSGLVATGLLLLTGTASAQESTPQTFETVFDGSGDADATATATAGGALTVDTEAVGGGIPGIPPLIPGVPVGPSSGAADARVLRNVELAPGLYEITITYSGVRGTESELTNRQSASVFATSSVSYRCAFDCGADPAPLIAFEELPASPGTVTSEFTLRVGADGAAVQLSGGINASSRADGRGASASADASADAVRFAVTRTG